MLEGVDAAKELTHRGAFAVLLKVELSDPRAAIENRVHLCVGGELGQPCPFDEEAQAFPSQAVPFCLRPAIPFRPSFHAASLSMASLRPATWGPAVEVKRQSKTFAKERFRL